VENSVKEANFSFFHHATSAFRKEVYTGEAGDAIASGHPASFAVHCKTRGAFARLKGIKNEQKTKL